MPCRAWSKAAAGGRSLSAGSRRAGERHHVRPIGARPGVRDEGERHFVDAGRQGYAELLSVPEGKRVADRRQREWARELERLAVVTRVLVGEAEVAGDRLGRVPAG